MLDFDCPFVDRRPHDGSFHALGTRCGSGASEAMTGRSLETPYKPHEGHLNGGTAPGALGPRSVRVCLKRLLSLRR